jgi:hypothetical protein
MAAPVPVPADFESKEVYKRQLTANDTKERSRLYINKSPAKTFIANPNQIKIKNFNLLGATKGICFFFFFFFLVVILGRAGGQVFELVNILDV